MPEPNVHASAADHLVCPVCRQPPDSHELDADRVCQNPSCGTAYPSLWSDSPDYSRSPAPRDADGIPVIFDGSSDWLADHDLLGPLDPLSTLPSRLAGLDARTAAWEKTLRTSMYVDSHWSDRDNLMASLCDTLLPHVDTEISAAVDLGCGPGRMAVELAHRTGAAVIGIDADPIALRWAQKAARGEPFLLPVRTSATRFELNQVKPPVTAPPGRVHWVCADVRQPPLLAESFDLVACVSLIDSVPDPFLVLGQASALLREGGYLLLAQPDAWMSEVTPRERWLTDDRQGWDWELARVGLRTVHVADDFEWELKRTNRMRFCYRLHARVALRVRWG